MLLPPPPPTPRSSGLSRGAYYLRRNTLLMCVCTQRDLPLLIFYFYFRCVSSESGGPDGSGGMDARARAREENVIDGACLGEKSKIKKNKSFPYRLGSMGRTRENRETPGRDYTYGRGGRERVCVCVAMEVRTDVCRKKGMFQRSNRRNPDGRPCAHRAATVYTRV